MVEVAKMTRLSLYNKGVFCGAQAIRWELEDLAIEPLPSLRTINRGHQVNPNNVCSCLEFQ